LKLKIADYTIFIYIHFKTLINRTIETTLLNLANQYPVITVTGPRQSGKTTLCRKVFVDKPYANLESPDTRQFAADDPRGFLAQYPDGAVFDEIQRVPDLVSYVQPMVDEDRQEGRFILIGSQQFEVSNSVNQSLAGRSAPVKLLPFSMAEIQSGFSLPDINTLLYNGFYPLIFFLDCFTVFHKKTDRQSEHPSWSLKSSQQPHGVFPQWVHFR
jgi:predicted AAA+ superfamily ATPase